MSGPTSDRGRLPTASARTPKGRSGTPAFPDSAAPESPKAARCWTPSWPTAAASRACSAATTAAPCTSWPTTGATAAPRTVSSWSTRSPYRTPGAPDKPRHRRDATHRPPTPARGRTRQSTAAVPNSAAPFGGSADRVGAFGPPVAPPCSICAFLISVSASGLSARRGDAVEASAAASLVASGHRWPDRCERVAAGHSHDDVSSHGAGDVDGPWVSQAELAQVACRLRSSRGSVRRRGGWEAQGRAVVYDRYGGPEVLRVADVPMPSPGAGQVRVRVVATSVNLSDWETLRGSPLYARPGGLHSPARRTFGSDIAGWVDATGEGVTRFHPGDEVYGDNLALKGGFADYTVAAASVLTPKPAELNFAQASTIPQAGAIALQGTDGAAAGRRV